MIYVLKLVSQMHQNSQVIRNTFWDNCVLVFELPVPSTVSGQTPMVLKLRRQDWEAHSTSLRVAPLGTCRHIEAFQNNSS